MAGDSKKERLSVSPQPAFFFVFFCMARGQRGNGRYIKKENVIRGAGRIASSGMSMKKLCDFK